MDARALNRTLYVDGIGCPILGVVTVAMAAPIAEAVGLGPRWPIVALGGILVVAGVENLLTARRPSAASVTALLTVDLVFAAAMIGLAVADPWGATGLARGAMLAVAAICFTMGALKLRGRAQLRSGTTRSAEAEGRRRVAAR